MYKVLVLFLLILSHCHLSNISSSDFPDYLFPFGDSASVDTYAKMTYYELSGNYLYYDISVYHEHGIQKVVVSGTTFEEKTEVVEEGATSYLIVGGGQLSYEGDYNENNPMYNIYVTIYPMTGDKVVTTFTKRAELSQERAAL